MVRPSVNFLNRAKFGSSQRRKNVLNDRRKFFFVILKLYDRPTSDKKWLCLDITLCQLIFHASLHFQKNYVNWIDAHRNLYSFINTVR